VSVTLNGERGRIERGYHVAAVLAPYRVLRDGDDWTLTGTLEEVNGYHLQQSGLLFVAPHVTHNGNRGEWRWPIQALSTTDGRLLARLGPPLP